MKAILYTILYILYVLLTLNERVRYMSGVNKDMHCIGIDHNILTQTDTYSYDPNRKPERDYITWKEFRTNHRF